MKDEERRKKKKHRAAVMVLWSMVCRLLSIGYRPLPFFFNDYNWLGGPAFF